MTLVNWRRLREGTGDGVVLAVDFGPRTGQRGFVRLAEHLGIDEAVYETIPPKPAGDLAASTRPDRYLEHWLAGLAQIRPPVRAVLAFCAGGRFAGAVAAAVADLGCGDLAVVLLDPSVVDANSLRAEFDAGIESLGAHLSGSELRAARQTARRLGAGTDLVAVAEALCAEQRKLVRLAFDRARIDPRLADGLCDRFSTYLGYLVAAGRADQDTGPEPVLVLASDDHPLPERHRHRARRLDLRHQELLGDQEVARVLRAEVFGAGAHPVTVTTARHTGPAG